MELFIYCAGVIVFSSFVVEWVYNLGGYNKKNDWRFNVRAEDIEELNRIFERG